jgi:hypothetical protein
MDTKRERETGVEHLISHHLCRKINRQFFLDFFLDINSRKYQENCLDEHRFNSSLSFFLKYFNMEIIYTFYFDSKFNLEVFHFLMFLLIERERALLSNGTSHWYNRKSVGGVFARKKSVIPRLQLHASSLFALQMSF